MPKFNRRKLVFGETGQIVSLNKTLMPQPRKNWDQLRVAIVIFLIHLLASLFEPTFDFPNMVDTGDGSSLLFQSRLQLRFFSIQSLVKGSASNLLFSR